MPKPYSLNLRERVVRYVDEGHSRRAAAGILRVSVSFVVNLVKAFRVMRESLAPKPSGGRRHAPARTASGRFFWRRSPSRPTSPCRSWQPEWPPQPARRSIPPRFRVGSSASAIASKTYGPPRLQGGLSRLAADPVCINLSGLEELPPAMMENTHAPVLIKLPASDRAVFEPGFRSVVRLSGHPIVFPLANPC